MFYWLYLTFASSEYVPVLNLLKYQPTRTGLAIVTAQFVVVALGSRFIRWMKARQGKGQPIRTDGIERHVLEKSGTPTMGGVMILAGLFSGGLAAKTMIRVIAAMAMAVSRPRRIRPETPVVVCLVTLE